jgi:hypothetical protein
MENKFKKTIEATQEVKNCYQNGLQALGKYSSKIELENTSKCEGSIDLDVCLLTTYPQDNRWDYVFSYKGHTYFVEVHSAHTSEVNVVLQKLEWLKDWLPNKAPEIHQLSPKSFYWIQSNGYHIAKNSRQEKQLAQKGLRPVNKLKL